MLIDLQDLETTDYEKTWNYQRKLHNQLIENRKEGRKNSFCYLLLTEHFPVITLGKHAKLENVLFPEASLKEKDIKVFKIERGGDVTYHAPGQLVVYPIIDIEQFNLGVKKYVNLLEETVIRTLQQFNIEAHRKDNAPGVWIGEGSKERKICALGIKCNRFCTLHGIALNVNIDLNGFSMINPCGFTDRGVTSMEKERGEKIDVKKVKEIFSHIFLSLIFSF